MSVRCSTCAHWERSSRDRDGVSRAACLREAPRISEAALNHIGRMGTSFAGLIDPENISAATLWPRTAANMRCGEHQPADPEMPIC
ncbi:hypothetical protein [Flavisphingomonas formosensis]|uniref:hypothetical protein n=1 Tax=Flavisphingomonas formosensis TaxID=861534 RepID=UPI0012F8450B|nr:hypothetical protein [Sphingomonas formosensis]